MLIPSKVQEILNSPAKEIDGEALKKIKPKDSFRLDTLLFGETQSRIVISCQPLDAVKVVERAKLMGVPAARIGTVGGDKLTVKTAQGEFSASLAELHDLWWNSIGRAMT